MRDMTDRRRSEEEIARLNESLRLQVRALEATNREIESFSYAVSHDLRSPLRAIDGFSAALEEDYADTLDDQATDYLRRIRFATQRMGRLIDDMLVLSRVTRQEMAPEPLDLSAKAAGIIDELRSADPNRVVDVVIAPGIHAKGDRNLIRAALDNLLGNAWKFTSKQPDARIEFGLAVLESGERAVFVRDNGAGFDPRYAHKLFRPFQRLHASNEYSGTGIGLATVQRIAARHGGRVWAEGVVGQGATFYMSLDGLAGPAPDSRAKGE
jgi:light-regulated signal transduction histidine kinase (bacteriophytochrome)